MRKKDPFLQAKMQRAQASSVQANLRPGKPQIMLAEAATAEGTPTGSPRSIRLLALRHQCFPARASQPDVLECTPACSTVKVTNNSYP
jgi:hypothetical protein